MWRHCKHTLRRVEEMCQVLSQLNNRTENYPCLTHMQRSQLNCFLHVKFTETTNLQPCVLYTFTWMSDLTSNFGANLEQFVAKSDPLLVYMNPRRFYSLEKKCSRSSTSRIEAYPPCSSTPATTDLYRNYK